MGRKKLWEERVLLSLKTEMLERLDAQLREGEARLDLIREAIASDRQYLISPPRNRKSPHEDKVKSVLRLANGKRSPLEIAAKLDISLRVVQSLVNLLRRRGFNPVFKPRKSLR